ncbi:MAG: PDZ domain-containing protein [Calditrichaeota bacterium]|nr:PDZ domain-containing protein [Calditrichota bacterium]
MKGEVFAKRVSLMALVALVAVAGTLNLERRREMAFETACYGRQVFIEHVLPNSRADEVGLRDGDIICSIDGRAITNSVQVEWGIHRLLPGKTITFEIQRGDSLFETRLGPERRMATGYVILNQVIGIIFALLGIVVWWSAGRDLTVSTFLRLNILASIAILLESHNTAFASPLLRILYGLTWLGAYTFLPASLADFLFRFPRRTSFRRGMRFLLFYAPFALLLILTGFSYVAATLSGDFLWISRYAVLFGVVFTFLLVVYILLSLGRMVYVSWRPLNLWEKNQNRWLLLCTAAGVSPFIFLHKLPILLGWPPILSGGGAISFLLLVPVGWGMAVASFRMLKVEWTLSRSIVYLVSAGIALYALVSLALLGLGGFHKGSVFSSVALLILVVFLLVFASLAIMDRLRWLLDRFYYGDWFNLQRAVKDASDRLSGTLLERDIVRILTEELPALLKIDKATLLMLTAEHVHLASGVAQEMSDFSRMISADSLQQDLRRLYAGGTGIGVLSPGDCAGLLGYKLAVPLTHGGELKGWLLLGQKQSRAPYGQRDFQLLSTLSTVAGLALSNVELGSRLLAQERRVAVANLAGGIAHEINNALYPVLGQAQLIEVVASRSPREIPVERISESTQIIADMCARIKRIADNLGHLSEPSVTKTVSFSLNDAAHDALNLLTETAGRIKRFERDNPQAPRRLMMALDEHLPQIRGDPEQLSQVFTNLILNAADAMESRMQGTLTVGTRLAEGGQYVIGFVEDTGTGIPPELHEKIFQPYFTTKPEGKGTGLGLAIVRSIIEAHGGSVRINSVPDQGTRVEFSLPISPFSASC